VYDVSVIVNGEEPINILGRSDFSSSDYGAERNKFSYSGSGGITGLAYDNTNDVLYVVDYGNSRIAGFRAAPEIFTERGNGYNADYLLGIITHGCPTNRVCSNPRGIVFDDSGERLFVSDGYNRVLVFDAHVMIDDKEAMNVIGASNFTVADGFGSGLYDYNIGALNLSYDEAFGNLFVVDSKERVVSFDAGLLDNQRPTISSTSGTQPVVGESTIEMSVTVDDPDDDPLRLKCQYSDDGGENWYAPYIVGAHASVEDPDVAADVIYRNTYQFYQYNANNYTTSGLYYLMRNFSGFWSDYLIAFSGNQDISDLFLDGTYNWNLALVTISGSYYTMYLNADDFPNAEMFDTYLENTWGSGNVTVDFWVDNVFTVDGGVYTYHQPEGVTILDDDDGYQAGLPAINATLNLGYQVGQETLINTEAGPNAVTVDWDASSSLNGNGAISGVEDNIKVRCFANDQALDSGPQVSNTFTVRMGPNTAPVVDVLAFDEQLSTGRGVVDINVNVSDVEDDNTKLKVEYSDDAGVTWYDPMLIIAWTTPGEWENYPDVDNNEEYQIGQIYQLICQPMATSLSSGIQSQNLTDMVR